MDKHIIYAPENKKDTNGISSKYEVHILKIIGKIQKSIGTLTFFLRNFNLHLTQKQV